MCCRDKTIYNIFFRTFRRLEEHHDQFDRVLGLLLRGRLLHGARQALAIVVLVGGVAQGLDPLTIRILPEQKMNVVILSDFVCPVIILTFWYCPDVCSTSPPSLHVISPGRRRSEGPEEKSSGMALHRNLGGEDRAGRKELFVFVNF